MIHDLHPYRHIIKSSTSLESIDRPDITQVRGQIIFKDQSVLHVRENYIVATGWVDYSYHWQTDDFHLIRRWDNAHEVTGIDSSPHHQHIGSEDNVQRSEPMTLENVLTFIDNYLSRDYADSPDQL